MQLIEQFYPPFQSSGFVASRVPFLDGHQTTATVSTTATLTAAQVATGYIINTGTAATLTLPTGTLLGAQLGAQQGDTFDLYFDNTNGTGTITVAVSTNAIQSAFGGTLTLVKGVTGIGCFRIMFASPTAYVFSRTA